MECPVDSIDPAFGCHDEIDRKSGKQPSHEVDCGDGHADTEQHTGKDSLRSAFTKSESQTCDDNGHEREAASDGGLERLHQNVDGVLPR